ncbi:MAG: DUF5696 domain-containing protein [Candidatus Aminicenantales bacterium]
MRKKGPSSLLHSRMWLIFFLTLASLAIKDVSAIDFSYSGPDCRILYRFTPRTGTLNDLTVIYNDSFEFSPSLFGGILTFILGGQVLNAQEGRHTSEFIEENISDDVYEAKFRWSYAKESFDFTVRISLKEKTLSVEFFTDPSSEYVVEFGLDRSEQTPDPKIIELPYGHNVLFTNGIYISGIIDPFRSNASTIYPLKSYHSDHSASYASTAFYHPLTDGRRNSLQETIYITVSPEISETFYHVSNPASPYRNWLTEKIIVDLWRETFQDYRNDLQMMAGLGMSDLFAIIHAWQKYGYDNGFPSTFPAGESFGGEQEFLELRDVCEANGYLFALHTNYVDFYENSDVWNVEDVALDPTGSPIKTWRNPTTGMQSYLMKPSRVLHYAHLYEPLIHEAYRTNSAFLDVHTSVLPSFNVDYDALVEGAGKQISTFKSYRDLVSYVRSIHSGPVAGEGFGCSTGIWAGYIDALEADPRSLFDVQNNRGGTDVPLIVDYKLKELHRLFVPHGAGYLERFYHGRSEGFTAEELERYRVTELAFGNAGFISNLPAREVPPEEILREYCFLKHMQRYYLSETPVEILYRIGDETLPLSDALRTILPSIEEEDLNTVLNEELSMLRITYSGGFTLYVNRSSSRSWDVVENSALYTLPPNGFLAFKDEEFLAYSAIVDGEKRECVCPAEPICCQTIFPPLSFEGRKVLNRSLSQREYINVLTWRENPKNRDMGIVKYRIYQMENHSRTLLVEVSSQMFHYWHRKVRKDRPYTYAITAVNEEGREGDPAYLTVPASE